MSDELKPCPFCGGKARRRFTNGKYGITYYAFCEECGAEMSTINENEMYEAWNRRTI